MECRESLTSCPGCDCSGVVVVLFIMFGSILALFVVFWLAAGFIGLCTMLIQKYWCPQQYKTVPVKETDDAHSAIELDKVSPEPIKLEEA